MLSDNRQFTIKRSDKGRVVVTADEAENIGFALPANNVKSIVDSLR